MLWPERGDVWRLDAKPAQLAFANVAKAIAMFEPVTVGVSKYQFQNARKILSRKVRIVEVSSDDAWMRDVGPTFVINRAIGRIHGIDWQFNAWGGDKKGLYSSWAQDELVALKVLELEDADRYQAPFILEEGSIHVDGEGTLITTEECLLNPNRNPHLSKDQIEEYLNVFLNVQKIIWLPRGVNQDETDGHVDNLCCFVKPGVVVLTWTQDANDPQHDISKEAFSILTKAKDAKRRNLQIYKIHQPGPLHMTKSESNGLGFKEGTKNRTAGDRLAGSYINFYMANGGIVMPFFEDPFDELARRSLCDLFPNRRVIGIPTREILIGGGNIHCITLQVPAIV